MTMDSMKRREFYEIFDRVSRNVDVTGCTNALEIELALEEARDESKVRSKIAQRKARRAWLGRRSQVSVSQANPTQFLLVHELA